MSTAGIAIRLLALGIIILLGLACIVYWAMRPPRPKDWP